MKKPKLTEDNLNADVKCIYKGKEYKTGNRYHCLVDLHLNGKFVRTVSTNKIKVVK